MAQHDFNCRCDRCQGLRRYPQPALCDWCGKIHAGDANNCANTNSSPSSQHSSGVGNGDNELEPLWGDEDPTINHICWDVVNGVKEITQLIKENDMLPAPTKEQRPQQSRSSRSNYRVKERTGPPYLRVEDLTEEPKRAKITGVQVRKTQYNDLTIKLALGGQNYFWGLTLANPNFEILYNLFGPDENRWMGEEFLIGLEFDEFSERNLMRAYPLDKAETKGARKKK